MEVVLLGTGTPLPEPERFGAAILVTVPGQALLFDAGRGAAIRLQQQHVPASDIRNVFLTHLHSDHVVGLPDVWLTGWVLGRQEGLHVWGPAGTDDMVAHLSRAFAEDVRVRQAPAEGLPRSGSELLGHVIAGGVVYASGGVRVRAFPVDHGHVAPAFGYRVEDGDRAVVISGDAKWSPDLVRAAEGADVVLQAAWLSEAKATDPPERWSIATAEEAGRIFAAAHPKLAVAYHCRDLSSIESSVRSTYSGPFVLGRDRLIIDIGPTVSWRMAD